MAQMVGGVGSDHATPECWAKLVRTENPDIFSQIFTVHPKRNSGGEETNKQTQQQYQYPATIYIIYVRLPAASAERLSFLRAHFLEMRQGRSKIKRAMRVMTKQNPFLAWGDFRIRRKDNF